MIISMSEIWQREIDRKAKANIIPTHEAIRPESKATGKRLSLEVILKAKGNAEVKANCQECYRYRECDKVCDRLKPYLLINVR